MYADGIWLKDHDGRTRILRGVNLGGSSKVPAMPDGATYCGDDFFDAPELSRSSDDRFRSTRRTNICAA